MVEAVGFIIQQIHNFFGALAVDLGGGIRLDFVIIILIVVSFFASLWYNGVKG